MCWCALLLFTGLAVGLAWQQATVRSIPECAAHVELALSGEVLAANRKSTDEWLLDVRVVGHGTLRTRNIRSGQSCQGLLGKRLLLRWRAQDMIQAGERWLFTLKLRVPWGAANPGGFDYRRWLLASGYSATGYIKTGKSMLKPAAKPFKARWQGNLRSLLEQHGLVHSTTLWSHSFVGGVRTACVGVGRRTVYVYWVPIALDQRRQSWGICPTSKRLSCLHSRCVVCLVYRRGLSSDACGGHVGLPACVAFSEASGVIVAGADHDLFDLEMSPLK